MYTVEFIDGSAPGISAALLNEPFHIKGASYNSGLLTVTIGSGRANFGGGLIIERLMDSTYSFTPISGTTYYIFLKNNNNNPFIHKTANLAEDGEVVLGSIDVTGVAPNLVLTKHDLRGLLPGCLNNDQLSKYVKLSNTNLYSAPTERAVSSGGLVKQFRVKYPGNYRLYFEYRCSNSSFYTYASVQRAGASYSYYTNSSGYIGVTVDLLGIAANELISISLSESYDQYGQNASYIRNVYLRGDYTVYNPVSYGAVVD
ncbi:MAG TPA: hypothetical protein VHY08_15800 [Bacillota bacterium]|nr:hypothetical protein [Bacillota bacterium]